MNIRKWQKPNGSEVRYYFDLRFGAAPFLTFSVNRLLDGRWIGKGDDGKAHIYTKTEHGVGRCRTEDGDYLDRAFFGADAPITWEEWETTFNACLTKSGNFSVSKYLKYEPTPKAAA